MWSKLGTVLLVMILGVWSNYRDKQDAIEREERDVIEALQVVNDGLDDHIDGEYLPTWIMTSRRIAGEELEDFADSKNYNLIERVYIVHVVMIGLQLCGKDPVMGAEKECLETMYSIILDTEIDGKLLFPKADPMRSLIYRSADLVFPPNIDRHKVYDRLNQVRRNDRALLNAIGY